MENNASGSFTDTDVEEDEKYERRHGASLLACSILKDYNTVLRNNISNKLHFDFQFLEFRHDNRKLFPDWTRIYPFLI